MNPQPDIILTLENEVDAAYVAYVLDWQQWRDAHEEIRSILMEVYK